MIETLMAANGYLIKLRMYDLRIFMPIVDIDPHLQEYISLSQRSQRCMTCLSKSTQTGKNTAAYPCAILPLRGRKDLDPHVFYCQPLHLM